MTKRKRTGVKMLVFLMAFAVMFIYSVMPMNQAFAASKTPGKVSVSKVAATSSSSVKVTWKKVKNAKKYEVYASTAKTKNFKRVATVDSSKKTYTVEKLSGKALKANKKYYFKVRAVNGKKKGKFSAVKSAKTKKKPASVKRKTVYVTPQWLKSAMAGQQPGYEKVVVCEVSYMEEGNKTYAKGHVPGAIKVASVQVEDASGEPGRYKAYNLLSVKEIRKNLVAKGITANTKVVLYDAGGDPCEVGRQAYGYLVAGVKDVKILNGDLKAWKKAGFKTEKKKHTRKAAKSFGSAKSHLEYWTSIEEAKAKLDPSDPKYDPKFKLVSIRSKAEWLGTTSGYGYMHKAGEPKGAVWGKGAKTAFDVADFVNSEGKVKKLEGFKAVWKNCKFKTDDSEHLAFYCGTGWRATVPFLVLYENGYKNISVYDGGWYEWLMNDSYPVQVGDPASGNVKYTTVGALPDDRDTAATIGEAKTATLTTEIDMSAYPAGKTVKVWVPVPQTDTKDGYQEISNESFSAPKATKAEFTIEKGNGNKMLYLEWGKDVAPADRKATLKFTAKRYDVSRTDLKDNADAVITEEAQKYVDKESAYVKVNDPIVKKYAAEAVKNVKDQNSTVEKTRAIYDWVINNLARIDNGEKYGDYTFAIEGCGYGDTAKILGDFDKYGIAGGHCTDLNSTFVALCRANGIAAREMFGIRLGNDGQDITGFQHCWAEFYLPGTGWVFADPADVLKAVKPEVPEDKQISKEAWAAAKASDTFKEKAEFFWGHVDNNRIVLSRGRDITFEPPQAWGTCNTFGYPAAEVGGERMPADFTKGAEFKYTITSGK